MKMKKWLLFAMLGVGLGVSMSSVMAQPKCCIQVCTLGQHRVCHLDCDECP
jgi:hypothetical protein